MFSRTSRIILVAVLAFLVFQIPIHVSTAAATTSSNVAFTGWGGTGMKATDCLYTSCNSTWPTSAVFPGKVRSTFEMEAAKLHNSSYNLIRVSFNPGGTTFPTTGPNPCAPDISGNTFGIFNATQLQRAIRIANFYSLWLLVDYHSYADMNSTYRQCWLTGWSSVITQFRNSYSYMIWEPLNEPSSLGGNSTWANLNIMTNAYNAWISQTRGLGDNHYVVVENLCSFGCNFDVEDYWMGYPGAYNSSQPVIDPASRVYISLHAGMGWNYDYPVHWPTCPINQGVPNCDWLTVHDYYNYTTADQFARYFYLSMLNGTVRTGWNILNTEGGALPHCALVQACLSLEAASGLDGSAGYTNVTLRFMQKLTGYLTSNNPRLGWVWFPMAEWASDGTTGSGTYGALSPNNGWGTKLGFAGVCVLRTVSGFYMADRNGDGSVDILDLATIGIHFGSHIGDPNYDVRADINLDGDVNIIDLALVASSFGSSC